MRFFIGRISVDSPSLFSFRRLSWAQAGAEILWILNLYYLQSFILDLEVRISAASSCGVYGLIQLPNSRQVRYLYRYSLF